MIRVGDDFNEGKVATSAFPRLLAIPAQKTYSIPKEERGIMRKSSKQPDPYE